MINAFNIYRVARRSSASFISEKQKTEVLQMTTIRSEVTWQESMYTAFHTTTMIHVQYAYFSQFQIKIKNTIIKELIEEEPYSETLATFQKMGIPQSFFLAK